MSNMRKQKIFNYYLVLICSIFMLHIAASIRFQASGEINYYNETNIEKYIETSDYSVTTPIFIDDSDPNYNWSKTALENAWCSGSGSWADPYIIEDITTSRTITVYHSNVHFKIMNCVFSGSFTGITLSDIENGILVDNEIYGGGYLNLYSCNLTVVSDMFFNDSNGLKIWHSRDLVITANTFNLVRFGIDAYNCNYSIISSNEFNYCWGNCIEFDALNIHNQIIDNFINNSLDYGIEFNGDDNTISNNIISRSGFYGLLLGGNNNYIFNNTIIDNADGIDNLGSTQGNDFVENTIINNSGWGVIPSTNDRYIRNNVSFNYIGFRCFRETNVLLKENNISNNKRSGIELIQCDNFNITDNLMYGCGFHVWDSDWGDAELLSHNISSSNLVNDRNLYIYYNQTGLRANNFADAGQIIMWYCNDSIIRDQDLSYASRGITSLYGDNITIVNNSLSDNNMAGIYIDGGSELNISGNLLSFSEIGIEAYGLDCSTITSNTANECTHGMYLSNLDKSTISHNILNNNNENGLYLWNGYSNSISNNIANNNDEIGFKLEDTNNNNFFENEANYNFYGLFLTNSYDNTITRNTFLGNRFGCIDGAGGNNVFDNICFDERAIIFARMSTWVWFGLVTTGSTIGLIVSIKKVIKKRKRKLKLERT